jgi:hypothetical protein
MAELLLGGRRTGRDYTVKDPDPGKAFPGGAIYLSFPGLGDRLAARGAGEIGERVTQYESPNALQCYAVRAPVTRRSGKSDYVVARRLAHNRYLGDAVHQWAFCSLTQSGWARELCDQKRRRNEPPQRPARPRQPLAGDPLALPHQGRALRRGHPRRQPQPRPRTGGLRWWLTEGVSSPVSDGYRAVRRAIAPRLITSSTKSRTHADPSRTSCEQPS